MDKEKMSGRQSFEDFLAGLDAANKQEVPQGQPQITDQSMQFQPQVEPHVVGPAMQAPEAETAKQRSPGRKAGSIIFNILFYCLIIAIVGGAAVFALSKNPEKSYFGYRLYIVKSPSMTPQPGGPSGGFRVGDTIVVKLCNPSDVQKNDIITFVPGADPNVYLTHRVVKVLTQLNDDPGLFFVTKGDANPSVDPPIAAKAVVGKVVGVIPKVGGIVEFVRHNFIYCLIAVISGIGCIILLRMYFSAPRKKTSQVLAT